MKAAHFQTPPCSSQSSSTINNPSPHPSPFLMTPGYPARVLPLLHLAALFTGRTKCCAFTLWLRESRSLGQVPTLVLDLWQRHIPTGQESLIGGDTAPSVNVSFVLNDISLGWGQEGQPFSFRSLLQWLEAACRLLNRQPRPVTALCCHRHSASSCGTGRGMGSAGFFPATNNCTFPSWEAALVQSEMAWV